MEKRVNCPDPIHFRRTGKYDRKKKFYINLEKNVGYCFRCKYSPLDVRAAIKKYNIDIDLTNIPEHTEENRYIPPLKLPEEFSDNFLSLYGRKVFEYLTKKRGLDPFIIAAYGIGYCEKGPYHDRVVVPVHENGNLVQFQCRTLLQDPKTPKCINAHKTVGGIPNAIFNVDTVTTTGIAVIVEGPFDALRIPDYGVSILGSSWNSTLKEKILARKPHFVVCALDQDDAGKACRDAILSDIEGIVPTGEITFESGKDIGEITEKELSSIYDLLRPYEVAPK